MKKKSLNFTFLFGGRSLITLTKFCPLLTTYLPPFDIGEGTPLLLYGKICTSLTFPVTPTYLPPLVTYFKNAPLLVCSLQMSIVIFSIINMF